MTPPLDYTSVILSESAYGGLPTMYWPQTEATGTTVVDIMAQARGTGYNATISGTSSRDNRPTPIAHSPIAGATYWDGATMADTASSPTISADQNLTIEAIVYAVGGGFDSVSHVINSRFNAILGVQRRGDTGNYYVADGNANGEEPFTSADFPPNTWTHIAIIYTPTGCTGYINGVSSGTQTRTTMNYNLGNTRLAGRASQAFGYFNGYMIHGALYLYAVAVDRLRYHAMARLNGIPGIGDNMRI